MKIGFYGLGRMGSNMVARLLAAGQDVVVMNRSPKPVEAAVKLGAEAAGDYQEMLGKLNEPVIWLMLPAGLITEKFNELLPLLPEGAIIIDGGNSDFRYSRERALQAGERNIHFIDVGTSGGVLGRKAGYCLMVGGGDNEIIRRLTPIFDALAQKNGWTHFGESGSGHFVKMVHNAIEYGLMESYAEGYRILKEGPYKNLDLAAAAEVWQHGSIIESKLNELTAQALKEDAGLSDFNGVVAESGEARWTLEVARDIGLSLPAVQAAFDVRLRSQKGETNYSTKLLSAMRNKFGGHDKNPQ